MGRIIQNGFECNSTKEFASTMSGAAASIQNTVARNGYAGKISGLASGARSGWVLDSVLNFGTGNGPYYIRVYFRVDTLPSAENRIIDLVNSNALTSTVSACITIDNTGALRLKNATTNVGSATSPLSTGQWYRLEIKYDKSLAGGSQVLELKIDGVVAVTSSALTIANAFESLTIGGNLNAEAQTTGVWYFDDIAINDSTGSNQNSYPNQGSILHTQPNGAGDSTQWTKGGSSPAATNYQSVNEVSPDDGVTYVSDNTSGHKDEYTVASIGGINSGDTINVVAVGIRASSVGSGASGATFTTRLKAASGGTTSEDGSLKPGASGANVYQTNNFGTNDTAIDYQLVSYTTPGTSNAWTKTDLDNAQIGVRLITNNTNAAIVSTLWLSVDFQPLILQALSDSVTSTDTILKAEGKVFSEAASLIDSLIFDASAYALTLTDNPIFTDTLSYINNFVRSLTDTPTFSDLLTYIKTAFRTVTDSVTSTDTITQLDFNARTLTDHQTLTDTLVHGGARNFSDITTFIESLIYLEGKGLSDIITSTDTISRADFNARTITDNPAFTDTLNKGTTHTFAELSQRLQSEDGQDLLDQSGNPIYVEPVSGLFIDTIKRSSMHQLFDVKGFIEKLRKVFDGIYTLWNDFYHPQGTTYSPNDLYDNPDVP